MPIELYDVIQIKPEHKWAGCLAIVSEVKSFGCEAYVEVPQGGSAYIRLKKEDYVYVGKAEYVRG